MGPGARNEGAEIQSGPVFIYILQQEIKKKEREREMTVHLKLIEHCTLIIQELNK